MAPNLLQKGTKMESLRDVRRKMEREIEKGRATPLKFEKMELSENSYKMITGADHYKKVLNWLIRLNEYRTGEATVANNVYMKPMAKAPEFTRTKSILERMNISVDALRRARKINPSFDGDCVLEEAICCFSLSVEEKDKCRYTYNDNQTYGFIMSNPYIMGLYCECESARADIAVNMEIKDDDPMYMKIMGLANINEVLFQCLLLDDIGEKDGMICAKLYTVYVVE